MRVPFLILDDNEVFAATLARMLGRRGFDAQILRGGPQRVAILHAMLDCNQAALLERAECAVRKRQFLFQIGGGERPPVERSQHLGGGIVFRRVE